MTFRPITKGEALAIHSAVVARFGGIDGVRDEGLLGSTLAQPFQSFAGIELYPTDEAKACRYAYGIIKDHPFADGNKRTATALMGTYLRLSGCEFKPSHAELLEAMLGTADGAWDFEPLVEWVQTAEG